MAENKQQRLCTVDHAAKQLDAIGWCDHRFWLNVARRRIAERDARRRRPAATDERVRDESSG